MKKLLAILLVLGLVLVSVAAMADVPAGAQEFIDAETANDAETPEYFIKKTYTTSGSATDVYPAEELKFTWTKPEGAPDIVIGSNNTFTTDGTKATYDMELTIPAATEYGAAGRYHYTVTENGAQTTSQGVTYNNENKTFNVDVYVFYKLDSENKVTDELDQEVVIYSGTDTEGADADTSKKTDTIENLYKVGKLTITKEIAGNLADPTRDFTITVTFTSTNNVASEIAISGDATVTSENPTSKNWTSKEITFTVKGGQSITIDKIPTGVAYTIAESGINVIDGKGDNTQINKVNDPDAYAVEYSAEKGTISDTTPGNVTVTNTKEITIPEGISVDFVPYVLIIALAGIALVAMKARKKEN